MITREQLFTLGVDSTPWTVALNQAFERFGINNAPRQAMFLAQCLHESGGFRHLVESLNYSADALVATWPHRFTRYEAIEMARDEVRIGERAYGGRMGNGPEGTGDGYRFRGRGIIQITGRENYGKCGAALGLNLLEHPELLEQPAAACSSAGWYWSTHGCNELADAGDFEGVTRRINGGLNGLADRKSWLTKVYHALGTQPAAPIEDRSPPPLRQRKGSTMGALFATLLPAVLQLFSGRAQAQIAKTTGADPAVAEQFMQYVMSLVGKQVNVLVTDAPSAIQAVAALTSIPNAAAKAVAVDEVESGALDYLDNLAPILDKIEANERAAAAEGEASRAAAAARNVQTQKDGTWSNPAFIITIIVMCMVAFVIASVLWKDAIAAALGLKDIPGFSTDMQSFVIGAIVGGAMTAILQYFVGTTRQSQANQVVMGEIASRRAQ